MSPTTSPLHHYNPDWLSDDALVGNFVARLDEFTFLRDELAHIPREGSAQHYLLVGVRGAGKTTLLKRLAVAIRRDTDLRDHLVALSFPEELYQVKNLSDFWWAACEALVDELDRLNRTGAADLLMAAIAQAKKGGASADPLSDAGFQCLQQRAANLGLRPVLLVDNLDMVFERIDKAGRKLKDPHAPAYWALREALSTTTSPIVIGGSVRLSEPFTDYDKAFYDFFIPKRLGKLSLAEVRQVLDRLADAQGVPEVKQRLQQRPGRIEALYELTGGNPRALGLIFELLRQGPNSRAVEDFERLMDITTPYYKARFEDLSEQAQVVMHALAVCRPDDAGGLRFGLTAAEIGLQAGLPTGTVSAQLDTLEREGLAEKSAAHGKTQYRIAEQLFRLWLQMRGNRRIRQNVIGLTRFLEALFSMEELQAGLQAQNGASPLAAARLTFATADIRAALPMRRGLEAKGADHLLQHIATNGGELEDFLHAGDLPEDLQALVRLREQLQKCASTLSLEEKNALIGSVEMSLQQKQAHVQALCQPSTAQEEAARLRPALTRERQNLLRYGLLETDLPLLFRHRARGCLPLPLLTPQDVEADAACLMTHEVDAFRSMVWRLVGSRIFVKLGENTASAWLDWGKRYAGDASANEWSNVAGTMRRSGCLVLAKQALEHAFSLGETSRFWFESAKLLEIMGGEAIETEAAYRKAIELDPINSAPWNDLGILLDNKLNRHEKAEVAFRKAIELNPTSSSYWYNLGILLNKLNRYEEAEVAFRKASELNPKNSSYWYNLGTLLDRLNRHEEAEVAFRKAIELEPMDSSYWYNLGTVLDKLSRYKEAEAAYRKVSELDPKNSSSWNNLAILLTAKLNRHEEAEVAFRKAIELEPMDSFYWYNFGVLLENKLNRYGEAEAAYRKAVELDPTNAAYWYNLGLILDDKLNCYEEAETAYRKTIELDPTDSSTWNNLGILLADQLNRYDEAEAAFHKAIELDPTNSSYWNNLGALLDDQLNRYDEAEAAFHKAIELSPTNSSYWNNLGTLLDDKLNRYDEAETAYRKAIELNPTSLFPWNNLGILLATKLKRNLEAEAAFCKTIELDSKSPSHWNNLGALLGDQLNRHEEAEAAYRKAIELDPTLARLWYNLGNLLETQERLTEASAAYATGASLDSDLHPYWRERRASLQARLCTDAARQALETGKLPALHAALGQLLAESVDLAAALVSEPFIEGFLTKVLAQGQQAAAVLDALRELGYAKHARPLLLAFEAAMKNRPDMLGELEPEVQHAARLMFDRLKG